MFYIDNDCWYTVQKFCFFGNEKKKNKQKIALLIHMLIKMFKIPSTQRIYYYYY